MPGSLGLLIMVIPTAMGHERQDIKRHLLTVSLFLSTDDRSQKKLWQKLEEVRKTFCFGYHPHSLSLPL